MTIYCHAIVRGRKLFYREAGPEDASTIVLLHGFPSSSHMFRHLIPQLADKFHVIAPDYVGFGYSDAPNANEFEYTFDNLAAHVEELLFGVLGLKKFSIYVQDYGAPIGYRIASKHQDAIEGIVVQNGNAYVNGIGGAFDPMKPFWVNRNAETEKPVRALLTKEATVFQYTHGVKDSEQISPDAYTFDQFFLDRPGNNASPARSSPQLPIEHCALRGLARVLPQPTAADADCVGEERPVLHRRRSPGLPKGSPESRVTYHRHRSLRPRRLQQFHRGAHSGISRLRPRHPVRKIRDMTYPHKPR
jgi:pimeloyl-ACP methyl ester carboxylesterase